ncbi:NAD-dependent epimerase/dehydratase family protein [Elizabethkingia anophelis]|nr:NAD-dependent epimerase/dehydratase family protein [Elizabethkingia anophelis]MCT4062926.1 NAD-dependent epimerase/dehydratase family protein [Elizabethkingia anophelis]MCT4109217.1 NAD-dependent epimerase/dehydratase family protein [Elizabethkingia anophelis]
MGDISFAMLVIQAIQVVTWLLYGALLQNIPLFIVNLVMLTNTILLIVMKIKVCSKSKIKQEMKTIHKVFLTGITGFIGRPIALKLKERGYIVTGLARKKKDVKALKKLQFSVVKGSLQDISILEKAKAGSYFFAESGFETFKSLAETIHKSLNLAGEPLSLSMEVASTLWGRMMATVALGSDCRMSPDKTRLFLQWEATKPSITDFIEQKAAKNED